MHSDQYWTELRGRVEMRTFQFLVCLGPDRPFTRVLIVFRRDFLKCSELLTEAMKLNSVLYTIIYTSSSFILYFQNVLGHHESS